MGDDYVCSVCGHEVNNPNKQSCGAGQCEQCGAPMEVWGDKDINVPGKPRLAEVLGVNVDEKFIIKGHGGDRPIFSVDENGNLRWDNVYMDNVTAIFTAINHPECIIRVKRLTGFETSIMRAMGARWASRDDGPSDDGWVSLWAERPEYQKGIYFVELGCSLARVHQGKFPSVGPGDLIELEADG